MKRKTCLNGFTIASAIYISFVIFSMGCWIGNIIKFVNCDFKAPYKAEVIHAIGIIGPVSIITVWFDDK